MSHGRFLEGASSNVAIMLAMGSLQKALSRMHRDVATACESNICTYELLTQAGRLAKQLLRNDADADAVAGTAAFWCRKYDNLPSTVLEQDMFFSW